jgi:alpha-2-macroglobulin
MDLFKKPPIARKRSSTPDKILTIGRDAQAQGENMRRRQWSGLFAGVVVVLVGFANQPIVAAQATTSGAKPATKKGRATTTTRPPASYEKLATPKSNPSLTVAFSSPTGVLKSLENTTELRWLFDRPVVELSAEGDRGPDPSSFVTLRPPMVGSYRWASTRMLVFTPRDRMPNSSKIEATLTGLKALDGTALTTPYTLAFTTPTVVCESRGIDRGDFTVKCNQEVDPASLATATRVVFRRVNVSAARYQPAAGDLALMRSANPTGFGAFTKYLTDVAARPEVLTTITPKLISPVRDSCAEESVDLCYRFSVPVQPADAVARLEFLPGIRSLEGPVLSTAQRSGRLPTFRTPLIVTRGCREGCNPRSGMYLESIGLDATVESADGRIRVKDVTPGASVPVQVYEPYKHLDGEGRVESDWATPLSLNWVSFKPMHTYQIEVDPDVADRASEKALGYTSITTVKFGRFDGFATLKSGERIVAMDSTGVRLRARNVMEVDRVERKLDRNDIVEVVRSYAGFPKAKPLDLNREKSIVTKIGGNADVVTLQSLPAGKKGEPGVYLVAARPRTYREQSRFNERDQPWTKADTDRLERRTRAAEKDNDGTGIDGFGWGSALVQRTNLGITLKSSPANVFVAVTALDSGRAVSGATVSLYGGSEKDPFFSGKTSADGFVTASGKALQTLKTCEVCEIVAVVEAKGDLAYAQSRWRSWGDDTPYTDESAPTKEELALEKNWPIEPGESRAGSLFAERGVYKLGEEAHLKGVLRTETEAGLAFPKKGGKLELRMTDPQGLVIARREVEVSDRGSFEAVVKIPLSGAQGTYSVEAGPAYTSMLVAAYRKPDFVVDVTPVTKEVVRGDVLKADADAKYLFGAPMAGAEASLTSRWTTGSAPSFSDRRELEGYNFDFPCVDNDVLSCGRELEGEVFETNEDFLDDVGHQSISKLVPTRSNRTPTYQVVVESNVTDISRQAFADRDSITVHPGSHYFGVKTTGIAEAKKPTKVDIVSVDVGGRPLVGKRATVELVEWNWTYANRVNDDGSVSRNGGWDTRVVETKTITTQAKSVVVSLTPPDAGYYEIRVHGTDDRGNWIEAGTTMYVSGDGYTAWESYSDEPTVSLVTDRDNYAPGETAKILVKSPWQRAEGMLTIERSGVVSSKRITLPSSASTIEVPIDAASAPNVFATVTLFGALPSDPKKREIANGQPQVLSATTSLSVPPTDRRLKVEVKTPSTSYLPGANTNINVNVTDSTGRGAASEVTLWAVDEGVLRLTGYSEPNLLDEFYRERSLQVNTADSRMRLTTLNEDEKGDEEGEGVEPGGGGGDSTLGDGIRQDFRTLAVWAGAVEVPASGSASVDVKLPESLTAFRIIAVAAAKADNFGVATSKLEVRKPLMLQPALPRFVNVGDTFEAGVVVFNRTGTTGPVKVQVGAADESSVALDGPAEVTVPNVSDKPVEVRFAFRATKVGRPKMVFSAGLNGATTGETTDRVAGGFPVTITQRLAVVATSGSVDATTAGTVSPTERVSTPADAIPGLGGLEVAVSTSSLAGLQSSIRDLVEYPFGCLEQRTSRIRVLLKLAELDSQYSLPGLPKNIKTVVARELRLLRPFQTADGGLSYWPGTETPDPYLSARTLILLRDAKNAGVTVPVGMIRGLTKSLQDSVGLQANPDQEYEYGLGFDIGPVRSLVAYALARENKPESASVDALYEDRYELPYEEQVYLLRAMLEAGESSERTSTLFGDLMASVRIEGGRAFVQSGIDYEGSPGLSYLRSSDRGRTIRDTSQMLSLLTRVDPKHPLIPKFATWLVGARTRGTWGNTLESGEALDALVQVSGTTESQIPKLDAAITLGTKTLITESFSTKSLAVKSASTTIEETKVAGKDFAIRATGQGAVNWSARLRYAVPAQRLVPIDQGFTIERTYSLFDPVEARASQESANSDGDPIVKPPTSSATSFAAGDLVRVSLRISTPQQRSNVAIEDLLPAGFEALNAQLTTTSTEELRGEEDTEGSTPSKKAWAAGVDHTEIKDDRVLLFATVLDPGAFTYTYVARATAPGVFVAPPAQVEEMYHPEVLGRTKATVVKISPPAARG